MRTGIRHLRIPADGERISPENRDNQHHPKNDDRVHIEWIKRGASGLIELRYPSASERAPEPPDLYIGRVARRFFTTFLLAAEFEPRLEFYKHQTGNWYLG
jgi:hypothetical protein